jgi:hypothetical protein
MGNMKYYLPGSTLIVMAMMIMAFPQILVALVAASIIVAGIGALLVGHMIRKSEMEFRNMDGQFGDHAPYGGGSSRRSVYRWWHRP